MSNNLSPDDIRSLSNLLSKIEPGILPFEIFQHLVRLMTTVTVAVVPLYYNSNKKLQVLLTKRDATDIYYPNMYHPIGTILRPTDVTIASAIDRLLTTELQLQNPAIKRSPVFVNYVFDKIPRGSEVSLIHWFELSEKPTYGELFSVDVLPDNIIQNDIPRIKMAVDHFFKS